ncbi:restriction endonuclease subunit S [Gimesia sp.]|uniref:restriction endonuclease subunit S n=1 Tax=Gimesia sp. TaxID=2024833 RepID=UPI0032EB0115
MIKELRTYGIEELPTGWTVEHVGEFAQIGTGGRDTQDKVPDGKYPFYVRSQTVERINSYSYDGVAVLTAGDGVGTGKVFHFVEGRFDFHQRVYKVSDFAEHVWPRYFYEFFRRHFIRQVVRYTAKTSVDSVRMEMISKMAIPLPPLSTQKKIASLLQTYDEEIELLAQRTQLLKKRKLGLAQQLLTGKLEPVSVE